ncbi:MAG: hypothetical protein HQM12_10785 [SAR324 cluster bacterium]|nr:hypothetical protein [SAR324 cluster bacterium]
MPFIPISRRSRFLLLLILVSLGLGLIPTAWSVYVIFPEFMEQLTRNTEDEAIRVGKHLSHLIYSGDLKTMESMAITSLMREEVKMLKADLQLMKLKLFSASGKVLFSTDALDIGQLNENAYFHEIVAKKQVYSKMVHKNAPSMENQIVTVDVVETYVPLVHDGEFVGAIEIYYDITNKRENLKHLVQRSALILWVMASGMLGIILFSLALINKYIRERETREETLKRVNMELEKVNHEMSQIQGQLIQTAKLISLGEMASGIAHEINQPLSIISLAAENSLMHLPEDAVKARDYVHKITQQVERCAQITNHLRTFGMESKIQKNEHFLQKILEEAMLFTGAQLRNRGIDIQIQNDKGQPPILCNNIQIEQVLINLISNARDAMESAPVKRLQIHTFFQKPWVVMDISDTGSGIPEAVQHKIFDPFFTTKPPGKGTGLGLSMSYGIMKEHEGEIRILNTGKEGTTIRLQFPVAG